MPFSLVLYGHRISHVKESVSPYASDMNGDNLANSKFIIRQI